jgi:hypothetical protein
MSRSALAASGGYDPATRSRLRFAIGVLELGARNTAASCRRPAWVLLMLVVAVSAFHSR